MQHKYPAIQKLEVELKQLEDPVDLPTRPREYMASIFFADSIFFVCNHQIHHIHFSHIIFSYYHINIERLW